MKKIRKFGFYTALSLVTPVVLSAQSLENSTFSSLIGEVLSVIEILIPILSALAFVFFFWGLSKFILNSGNKENIQKGRNYMLWGILAIFILLSFRAIITFVSGELDLNGNGGLQPHLKTDGLTPETSGRVILE